MVGEHQWCFCAVKGRSKPKRALRFKGATHSSFQKKSHSVSRINERKPVRDAEIARPRDCGDRVCPDCEDEGVGLGEPVGDRHAAQLALVSYLHYLFRVRSHNTIERLPVLADANLQHRLPFHRCERGRAGVEKGRPARDLVAGCDLEDADGGVDGPLVGDAPEDEVALGACLYPSKEK